ncbi:outer membrane protein transport protein [Thauera sp.]|uniref:OmpP1/FadL family transporter n=1 Tax=Thauera sp. TaxID=1905334 RepID=UPI002612E003|nr:outer membrane protein transport protein [Thauera sp.]
MKIKSLAFNVAAAAAAFAATNAMAAGFALQNQNGAGTGYAYAGSAAVAEDASTIYFNPAGMLYLSEGHHLTGALTVLDRSLKFSDEGSTPLRVAAPPVPAYPLGDNGGDAGGYSFVPALFWTMSMNKDLRVGVGVSPTFGNATEWDDTFVGRYQGSYSEIKAINVNPSVALRVNDVVSLGFGVNFVKFEADLRGKQPVTALLPSTVDVESKLSGDDTGWGWNAGALFQLSPATRIGVTYRSTIDLDVEGGVEAGPGYTPAKVSVELPDTASLAVAHQVNDRLQVLADYTWTGWSSLPRLNVQHGTFGVTLTDEYLGFKDSYRLGLGMQYQYTDALRLRAGVAYDQSPIRKAEDRTVRLPDSDRTWLAFGFNYKLNKQTSIDAGYAHLFFDKEKIDRRTVLGTTATSQFVRGSFDTSVNILSVQLNHSF